MNTTTLSEGRTTTQPVTVLYTAKTHTTGGREGGASRTSDGRLDVIVPVPASQPTKCAVGGKDLSDLYVTSAWAGLEAAARADQPHAGSLFRVRPGVRGKKINRYAG